MDPVAFSTNPVAVTRDVRAALATSLRRLRHDLGKSMSLQLRFAGPDASDDDRGAALYEDVCRTRRGPSGTVSAFELFDEAWSWLSGAAPLPGTTLGVDLTADAVVTLLRESIEALRANRTAIEGRAVRGAALRELAERAQLGARCCRALVNRYPEAVDG